MNKLQRFFLDLKNKKYKGDDSPLRENISYDQVKSVGLLFDSYTLEAVEPLSDFIKHLLQDGKQVKILTFQDTKRKPTLSTLSFNHHIITDKDISIFGEINSFLADDFIKTEFDYLFCVANEPSDIFDNILLRSKAKCRVGRYSENDSNYELMIKLNENEGTNALIQQMYYYVKTIKND